MPADPREFRRRMILNLVSSPATLGPFVAGVSTILGAWAVDASGGAPFFAGTLMLLGSAGALLTRLIHRKEEIARAVAAELQAEERAARERALDALMARLSDDDDPRDDHALHDLRKLAEAIEEAGRDLTGGPEAAVASDIMLKVGELFEGCVRALERNAGLAERARTLRNKAARKPLEAERRRILDEVDVSLEALGTLLAKLSTARTAGGATLADVRGDLDRTLEVARRVEERMKSFDPDAALREPPAP